MSTLHSLNVSELVARPKAREYSASDLAPDLADRMRKSLRLADITSNHAAALLDVSRSSVSNWINGRVKPTTQTLMLWAQMTGVPYVWLRTEEVPPSGDGGTPQEYTPWDSNPEPSDSGPGVLVPFLADLVDLAAA